MSGRLRSYARMAPRSAKVEAGADAFAAVYREVDQRSEGRCEVVLCPEQTRCPRRGVEHHHLYRPRRAHHTAREVVHVCRPCHDRTEWPFARGRLVYLGTRVHYHLGTLIAVDVFLFTLRYASDKWAARR